MKNIDFDKVADIYDYYVKVDFDIPFFLEEIEKKGGKILELMCGTGRVSIPLLEKGYDLTCVDYSKEMLNIFRKKVKDKKYKINIIESDICDLELDEKFDMILIPFHSFGEILNFEKQKKAIEKIYKYLKDDGVFIITLQNSKKRISLADGKLKFLGEFDMHGDEKIFFSYVNSYNSLEHSIEGYQFYEIYNSDNLMVEKRVLKINFRLTDRKIFEEIIREVGFKITGFYGDYNHAEYYDDKSEYMIYKLIKDIE